MSKKRGDCQLRCANNTHGYALVSSRCCSIFPCKKRTHASVMSTLDTAGSSGSADCGNRKCGDTVVVGEVHDVSSVVSRIMPREDRVDRVVSWLAGEIE